MMSKILTCITIDTEADCDSKWQKKEPPAFDSVLQAIPQILRPVFDEMGVKPTYFVSPEVVENDDCCAVLRKEIERGAEIGTHLHAEEVAIGEKGQDSRAEKKFSHSDYSDEIEFQKIEYCHELIFEKFGIAPKSFRAGKFGADIATMHSIASLGYSVDSSVTPNIDWSSKGGPNFRDFHDQPYFIDLPNNDFKSAGKSSLLEIPVTVGGKRAFFLPERWYLYRWLRPTNMRLFEMKRLIQEFIKRHAEQDYVVLCMMFHSMELLPKISPYVRNTLEQKFYLARLNKILKHLKNMNAQFLTLQEIYDAITG